MTTIACFGDVSGHLAPFLAALDRLGVRPGEPWPQNLCVVQVGDLVHKGPDSDAIVALVDDWATRSPTGAWIQLAGNHESTHVGGIPFVCDDVAPDTTETLERWQRDGFLRAAVAFTSYNGRQVLVTHAGLTRPWWHAHLGAERDAGLVTSRLNAMWADDPASFTAGVMLGGGPRAPRPEDASPIWAHPTAELWPGWLAHHTEVPFSQVHGHASAYWWDREQWSHPAPDPSVMRRTEIDRHKRHVTLRLKTQSIVGIDPGFGRHVTCALVPLVCTGTLLGP